MATRINQANLQARFAAQKTTEKNAPTRRTFLKAGMVTAAAALGDRGQDFLRGSNFSLVAGSEWLSLRHNGEEKFRLDAAKYHGNPQIWKSVQKDSFAFGMRNARFPGTDLCSDLICEMWTGMFGTQVSLAMDSLGLSFRGLAKDWLSRDGLMSRLPRSLQVLDHEGFSVFIHGCSVLFNSAGHFRFQGNGCAEIQIPGESLTCRELTLHLAEGDRSLLKNGASRRTTLVACRGSESWRLQPPAGDWRYRSRDGGSVFDSVEIEAHESSARHRSYAVVATRNAQRPPLAIDLKRPLRGSDGRSPSLLLRQPVYARSFSGQSESLTTASLANPAAVSFGNLQLLLRESNGRPSLRVVEENGRVSASFAPDASFRGRMWEAVIAPKDTHDSWPIQVGAPSAKATGTCSIEMNNDGPFLTGPVRFRVFRPADLLDLTFELRNIRLFVRENIIFAEKDDPSQDSLMIALLPSQTLVEQAFPSSTDLSDVCSGVQFPAAAFLARDTRISFKLFGSNEPCINIDLDMLLGWGQYAVSTSQGPLPVDDAAKLLFTSIEMPGGLSFAPVDPLARFVTSGAQSVHTGNLYRLWTGRLQDNPTSLQICAVAEADGPQGGGNTQFGLSNADRASVLAQLDIKHPLPLQHLAVSTAGGWLKGHTRLSPDLTCKTDKYLDSLSLNIAGGVEELEQVSYPVFLNHSSFHSYGRTKL